jgi:hypothetical protein
MKKPAYPIPTTLQLASIVAQLLNHQNSDALAAAAKAVSVWEACASQIEAWPRRIAQRMAEIAQQKADADELKELKRQAASQPTPFAATSEFETMIHFLDFCRPESRTVDGKTVPFERFLSWIMPNVRKGNRKVNFRKALMAADGLDNIKAGDKIAELEKREWFKEQRQPFAIFFERWRKKQSSRAGRKGATKRWSQRRRHKANAPKVKALLDIAENQ